MDLKVAQEYVKNAAETTATHTTKLYQTASEQTSALAKTASERTSVLVKTASEKSSELYKTTSVKTSELYKTASERSTALYSKAAENTGELYKKTAENTGVLVKKTQEHSNNFYKTASEHLVVFQKKATETALQAKANGPWFVSLLFARFQSAPPTPDLDFLPVLWYFPLSFATHKARLALEEKKIPYRLTNVNILTGDNLAPSYMKINPSGTVPTLRVEDRLITSSSEILLYADSVGQDSLGGSAVDKEKLKHWLALEEGFDANMYTVANQSKANAETLCDIKIKVAEKRMEENPELADLYKARIAAFKTQLESAFDEEKAYAEHTKLINILQEGEDALGKSTYLAGEEFSMCDVVMMTVLARVEMVNKEKELIHTRPALHKYWLAMKARPSYKKVVGANIGVGALVTLVPTLGTIIYKNATKKY